MTENDKIMNIGEAAQYMGRAVNTLQKWDRAGKLRAHRNEVSNRRYYYKSELDHALGKDHIADDDRKIIAYARVSSHDQKDDLKNQINFLRQYINAKGIIADEYIGDIGSGLNYKREKWLKLIKEVDQNKIRAIYVTYQDRFIRFGFNFFKEFCEWHNCKIIVLNNETTSPDQELVEDSISIIHAFSCRLYGLRRYKNKIKHDPNLKSVRKKVKEHAKKDT